MTRNYFLYLSLALFFFSCQVGDLEDGIPLQEVEEEVFFEATFVSEQNARVAQKESLKLQVSQKGSPANRQISFRFLIDREVFDGVSAVEIISLEAVKVEGAPNFKNPLIAFSNNGRGKHVNMSTAHLPSQLLTNVRLGFSLLDASGDYLEGGFFDLNIKNEGGKNPVITFNKSAETNFAILLKGSGKERSQVGEEIKRATNAGEEQITAWIDNVPSVIFETTNKEEANQLKAALEAVGATVDLKRAAEGGNNGGDEDAVQKEFEVILSSPGAEKLKVIQVLQIELQISEKEAITLVEQVPVVILARSSKEEANQLKAALEAVGATVDLKRAAEGGNNGGDEDAEQKEFEVILSSPGAEKLKVIQVLQIELQISEKEAITLVEQVPVVILARSSKEEANQLKAALEAVGATVDLK